MLTNLKRYWAICPELRHTLFKENRPGYLDLAVEKSSYQIRYLRAP